MKPSGPRSVRGWTGGPGTRDPGQYSFGQATPLDLIFEAYGLEHRFQVEGKMPLDQPVVDVVAKLPAEATKEQFRVMMQNLLAERFHLKVHIESKQFSG